VTHPVSVDEAMGEVRAHVRARLRAELERLDPGSPLLTGDLFDEAETIYRKALARRRLLMMPSLLLDESEWELDTKLRLTSHRPRTGTLILFVKRKVILPLTRWLYEFSRDNFERQARVNETLMASIETLVVEVLTLRREVEALRAGQRTDATRTPDLP
jgi:hypothetical protein